MPFGVRFKRSRFHLHAGCPAVLPLLALVLLCPLIVLLYGSSVRNLRVNHARRKKTSQYDGVWERAGVGSLGVHPLVLGVGPTTLCVFG